METETWSKINKLIHDRKLLSKNYDDAAESYLIIGNDWLYVIIKHPDIYTYMVMIRNFSAEYKRALIAE